MNKHERDSLKAYNKIASNYDESLDGKLTAQFKKTLLTFCDVSDGDKVLDVGCGNGTLIHEISQKGSIEAYGVDISPNMIAECKKRYVGIQFDVSSAESFQFEDDSLNVITICCVLHHLNDAELFVKEAKRVLKKDGVLLIAEIWIPAIIRQIANMIILPLYRAGDNTLFSRKMLKRLATNNQFEVIETYRKGFIQIIKARKI
ncbi:MAG: class I SAM-dependent methyltransferase [Treponema sp.]|nr:class I SAM-dependent methyltransferase [Treponema sp.]